MMEMKQLKQILEGAILAAGEPVTLERLQKLFAEEEQVTIESIKQAISEIKEDCEGRAYHLKEVGSGFRFQVDTEHSAWIARLWDEKPPKYSKAVLETLALVAYRQPVTRPEVEEIRGVTSSSHIFKTLLERDWIRVIGHKDVPGRPSLFATTKQFLDYFNLQSLEDLPTLAEIMDLDKVAEQLELNVIDEEGAAEQNLDMFAESDLAETEATKELEASDAEEPETLDANDSDDITAESEQTESFEVSHDETDEDSGITFAALAESFAEQTQEAETPEEEEAVEK